MSNTRNLIDALASGETLRIEDAFATSISEKINATLSDKRQEVAQGMFASVNEETENYETVAKKAHDSTSEVMHKDADLADDVEDKEGLTASHKKRLAQINKDHQQAIDLHTKALSHPDKKKIDTHKHLTAIGLHKDSMEENKRTVDFHKSMSEETTEEGFIDEEQLDELSKSTLNTYIKRATTSAVGHAFDSGNNFAKANVQKDSESGKSYKKAHKRMAGIDKAVNKLTK